jgi:hypothetical protein
VNGTSGAAEVIRRLKPSQMRAILGETAAAAPSALRETLADFAAQDPGRFRTAIASLGQPWLLHYLDRQGARAADPGYHQDPADDREPA